MTEMTEMTGWAKWEHKNVQYITKESENALLLQSFLREVNLCECVLCGLGVHIGVAGAQHL